MMRLPPFLAERSSSMDQGDALRLKRRSFIRQVCSSTLLAAGGLGLAACRTTGTQWNGMLAVKFLHGVASGDPLTDRVILWTRMTPDVPDITAEERDIDVHWQVATDRDMQEIVVAGMATTGPDRDYTVKVDAFGLRPGQIYYYRFSSGGAQSPVGRTKTLPGDDATKVKFAVFSCANYPAGYFNVYADAARQDDIDVALHIGDYIYEYESTGYACDKAEELGRVSEPANLLLVLGDYRRRYAQYRTDRDLQAVHARLPFIAVWDDHEFADDAWRDGSADHQPGAEGPFSLRKAAAMRAYQEWMPIRLPDPARPEKIYRSFDFGKVASLHMLDTRIVGRDQQVMISSYYDADGKFDEARYRADVASPRRNMMGAGQLAWLEEKVGRSRAAWQIIGQQVLMARFEYPLPVAMGDLSCADYAGLKECAMRDPAKLTSHEKMLLAAPTLPCYLDSWDGYPGDREKLFNILKRHGSNVVVLAGDTHNAWASDLRDAKGQRIGVEFAGPSVSSPGMECSHPDDDPDDIARTMKHVIEPLYYAQTSKRGYMIVTATPEQVSCDWRFVDTVHNRNYIAKTERSLRTLAGPGNRKIIELA
jgi:alkaline phosphatase D